VSSPTVILQVVNVMKGYENYLNTFEKGVKTFCILVHVC